MKMLIAVAVAVSGGVASFFAPSPSKIDTMETASISGNSNTYSLANIAENTTCIVKQGDQISSRTRKVAVDPVCDEVWPRLSSVQNWTENSDGTVILSDANGGQVLQFAPGGGDVLVPVDPPAAPLDLTAIR
jgi:hypothetical protein